MKYVSSQSGAFARKVLATTLSVGLLAAGGAFAAADIDGQGLINADKDPGNWLTYHGSYKSWHYSALDQINTTNVGKLQGGVVARRLARQPRPAELPAGHRRRRVLLQPVQPGVRARRRQRADAVDVQAEAQRGPGRQADALALQPRHRRGLRQHLHGHAGRQAGRDRHEDRQAQLGNQADRLREADGRFHRRARCWSRTRSSSARRAASGPTAVRSSASTPRPASRCGSSSRSAATTAPVRRAQHLGQRLLEDRWRRRLDGRRLRPGDQHGLVGHGQPGSAVRLGRRQVEDRRSASRRQSVHDLGPAARSRHRQAEGATTRSCRTTRGTSTPRSASS